MVLMTAGAAALTEGGEYLAGCRAGQALGAQQVVGQGTRQHSEHILAQVGQAGQQAVLEQVAAGL